MTVASIVVRLPSPGHLARSYGAMAGIQADERTRAKVIEEVSVSLQSYVGTEGLTYPIEAIIASARMRSVGSLTNSAKNSASCKAYLSLGLS